MKARTGISQRGGGSRVRSPHRQASSAAFTLIELLAVIAIMALIAALVGPTVTQFRKGDAIAAATRQMLDAVDRARQLAISEHTTVYMLFVRTNFWNEAPDPDTFLQPLNPRQRVAVTNLIDKQLIGYNFLSLHSVGDQPGRNTPHYLSSWQALPEDSFVPLWKFNLASNAVYRITNSLNGQFFDVQGFQTNAFPFPDEEVLYSQAPYSSLSVTLPYIAFNYLGQLTSGDGQLLDHDEFIPLARGNVAVVINANKVPIMMPPPYPPAGPSGPGVVEAPPGNSITSFNLIHIDRLTGRARVERQEVQ
jgi:prepilin-type N-terminal cleavage/methylation domain-containing protein